MTSELAQLEQRRREPHLVSVFVLCDESDESGQLVEKTVASLQAQSYGERSLEAQPSHIRQHALLEMQILSSPYGRIQSDHDTEDATNLSTKSDRLAEAIACSTGKYVLTLRAGDVLVPTALVSCVEVLESWLAVDLAYCDHDYWQELGDTAESDSGEFSAGANVVGANVESNRAVLKTAWSPETLRSYNYLGPLWLARRDLVAEAVVSATSAHSMALLVTERARRIAHIPEVLCHQYRKSSGDRTVGTKDEPDEAAVRLQVERLGIQGVPARTSDGRLGLRPELVEHPLVSVVVLTGGMRRVLAGREILLVENCLRSMLNKTTYPNYEVVVVLDRNVDPALESLLNDLDESTIRTVRDDKPFNFSAANNLGAKHAKGEHLIFLNDDTEVVTGSWIEQLVMYLSMSDVGVVGAQLRFGDGRIQHAGLVLRDGYVEHRYSGYSATEQGYQGCLLTANDVSAVTGACLGIEGRTFWDLGGFSDDFPLNFNDVDLCLRVNQAGMRIVLDQECVLLHHETSSRGAGIASEEQELFNARWGESTQLDPFHHPGFTPVRMEHLVPDHHLVELRQLVDSHIHTPNPLAPRILANWPSGH